MFESAGKNGLLCTCFVPVSRTMCRTDEPRNVATFVRVYKL